MCPCDKAANRVCRLCANRIKLIYAAREQARKDRRVNDAHTHTLSLLDFPAWAALAVTGEYASNAPAFRAQQEETA